MSNNTKDIKNLSPSPKKKGGKSALAEPSGATSGQVNESTNMTIQDASLSTVVKDSKFIGQTGASEVVLPVDESYEEDGKHSDMKNLKLNT